MISKSRAWEIPVKGELSAVERIVALKHPGEAGSTASNVRPGTDSSKDMIYAWKVKCGGPDVNEAQCRIFSGRSNSGVVHNRFGKKQEK